MLAVAGKTWWSGVDVATMTRPTSLGGTRDAVSASHPAWIAIVPVVSPSLTKRRSAIPVRLRIHSSDVSTNVLSSSFDTILDGNDRPRPEMRANRDALIRRAPVAAHRNAARWRGAARALRRGLRARPGPAERSPPGRRPLR